MRELIGVTQELVGTHEPNPKVGEQRSGGSGVRFGRNDLGGFELSYVFSEPRAKVSGVDLVDLKALGSEFFSQPSHRRQVQMQPLTVPRAMSDLGPRRNQEHPGI